MGAEKKNVYRGEGAKTDVSPTQRLGLGAQGREWTMEVGGYGRNRLGE